MEKLILIYIILEQTWIKTEKANPNIHIILKQIWIKNGKVNPNIYNP